MYLEDQSGMALKEKLECEKQKEEALRRCIAIAYMRNNRDTGQSRSGQCANHQPQVLTEQLKYEIVVCFRNKIHTKF